MVSNQALVRGTSGGAGHPSALRAAACGAALLLVAGCAAFGSRDAAPATRASGAARAPAAAVTAPQSSVDAALARGGTDAGDGAAAATAATQDVAPAATAGPVLNPDAPRQYTVKRGDTLWDISALFLRDPWLWPEIWQANPAVQNPHLIYPGDVLTLAYGADGRPQVRLADGTVRAAGGPLRVQPLVRETALEGPVATIPYEAIAAFLGRPSVVAREDVRDAPRVAALRGDHIVAGTGHDVYIKGLAKRPAGRYSIVRIGDPLKDPESGKVLGYFGSYAATARVDSPAAVTRATLVESGRETRPGDIVYAEQVQPSVADFTPRPAPANLRGQIMAVVDGVLLIGQYRVVAINRGARHGLETGHVLAIEGGGGEVRDGSCRRSPLNWCIGATVDVPQERVGTLLVFKTYRDMSFGLVVRTDTPVRIADTVRSP